MNNKSTVTLDFPLIRQGDTVRTIKLDFIIALVPCLVWAVYIFGFRVLSVVAVCVVSSVIFEYLCQKILKHPVTVFDFSAVVTGILLAFTLPVSVPLWVPVIGAFIAIVLAGQLLSLTGKNIINPVVAARLILYFILPDQTSAYVQPLGQRLSAFSVSCVDIVAGPTPLASLKEGTVPDVDIFDLFIGNIPGAIGEVSVLLILIGGLYLLMRRVLTWHVVLSYLGTVAVLCFLFPQAQSVQAHEFMLTELCSGALMFGAVFMASDGTGTPVTSNGRIIYGIGCGALTVGIRYFAPMPEGVALAILVMNLLSRLIDMLTRPKPFGYTAKN